MIIRGVSHLVDLARSSADAKSLKLETEQVAPFSQIGYSILPMVDAIRL
jgi:hypothetical protein